MLKFTLKRLFVSVSLIAIGLATWFKFEHPDPELNPSLSVFGWFFAGALIGAGALSLYKHPILGAAVGAVIGIGMQWLFAEIIASHEGDYLFFP
jgi:hypothetical protein